MFIILSCISVVCAMDVSKSSNADISTTASASYDNNIKQDIDEELYDDEIIPDNNFEDGYENSEIIELNDTTIDDRRKNLSKMINPQIQPVITQIILREVEILVLL